MTIPESSNDAFVGIGANLGDAIGTVRQAIVALSVLPRTELTAQSSLYRTAPVDADGPDFINAVALINTSLEAHALLAALLAMEVAFGRERPFRNAPRTLDLDLLLYDKLSFSTPDLVLPHPRMHQRAFVLAPLSELAPGLSLEPHGKVETLLGQLTDQPIERIDPS